MMKRFLTAAVLLAFFAIPCFGATTIVGASDPWPPFVDPDNPKGGITVEIVRAALATQGYELKMEIVPWARAENGVREGKYDILTNMWMTESRKKDFMFGEPYAQNELKFVKRKGDPFEYKGFDSLKGLTIGVIRDYGYGDDFWNATDFKRAETSDFLTNVKKLVAKRVDLTLEDEIVGKYILSQKAPELLEQVEFTAGALSSNNLYVTSGFKNPKHEEFINAYNKGLAEIKANGTYQKIMASYGMK